MNAPDIERALAHYQSMAEEARLYRLERERNDRLVAQVEADQLLQRIRNFDTYGCFAPSWVERAEDALRREFGAWWIAWTVALIAFFAAPVLLVLALMGVRL
jgi:hypothetical protein